MSTQTESSPLSESIYKEISRGIKGIEIVSRKFTQLGEISEATAIRYLKELHEKYPRGAIIAEVHSNLTGANKGIFEANQGNKLKRTMILEVPVQTRVIPQSVIDYALQKKIQIRDIEGNIYK